MSVNNTVREINLVDVTIRDGGCCIDYMYTSADVLAIVSQLQSANVPMIEIGHGYGLGAERTISKLLESEESFIKTVNEIKTTSMIGMFANGGIATTGDIIKAKELGLDFVRIGFMGFDGPYPFDKSIELLKVAKEVGLWASLNMVRSQFLTEKDIDIIVDRFIRYKGDVLYVVDSTGGMLPSNVYSLIKKISLSGVNIGFHGHQNLDLGIANSLIAFEAGATYLDGTLGGIGRESGNVQLEALVAVLDKSGYDSGVNPFELSKITNTLINPLLGSQNGITKNNLAMGRFDLLSHVIDSIHRLSENSNELELYEVLKILYENKYNFETDDVILKAIQSVVNSGSN